MGKSNEIRLSLFIFYLSAFSIILGRFLLPLFNTTGFSVIMMADITCAILGIWILRKIMIKFFSEKVSAITMLLIVSGTNYFQLTACDEAMPQNYLFTLYALVVWLTIRWHESPKKRFALFLGLFTGLAILIRPASAVILLIPILWGIADKDSWQRKWILIRSNLSHLIICLLFLCAVVLLQIIFWKDRSSNFFNNGFESGERIRWIAPYLWQVLFSYKNGWLIYTPMMFFSLVGFYFLAEKHKSIFYSVFLFFLLNLFIAAGWPAWWYGESLGQKALVGSYLILALPLGFFIQWVFTNKIFLQTLFFLIFIFFIILNLFQIWQYMNFIIEPSNMTREYYWAVFGKTSVSAETRQLTEGHGISPESIMKHSERFSIKVLASFDFEDRNSNYRLNLDSGIVKSGKFAFRMDSTVQFSPGVRITYGELTKKSKAGIRVIAWIYSKEPFNTNPGSLVVTSNHSGLNYQYESIGFDDEKMKAGQWNKVVLHYITPESPDTGDILQVYIWYRGKKEIYADDIKIELFEPK